MKINELHESTTSGSIATVSQPMTTQRRGNVGKGVYSKEKAGNLLTGKKTNKKFANSIAEGNDPAEFSRIYNIRPEHRARFKGLINSGYAPDKAADMIKKKYAYSGFLGTEKINEDAKKFTSKQQVIDYFVKQGKTAAQGASAWDRGWRGPKPKAKPASTAPKNAHWLDEARLEEDDLILVPGQGHKLKSGFIPHDQDRRDHEVEMARNDMRQIHDNARKIQALIQNTTEDEGLDGWVQAKITKAADYLNSVSQYLEGKKKVNESEEVYVLHIDNNPVTRYNNKQEAVAAKDELLSKYPDAKIKVVYGDEGQERTNVLYIDGKPELKFSSHADALKAKEMVSKKFPGRKVELKSEMNEDLKKWFKEKWVRFGPDGKIRGDCARGDDSEGKPKCLPQSKAHSLGKKGRASAAARKRREDPNPERQGKAINVATKKKTNEEYCPECGGNMYPESMINEKKDACYYKVKSRYKVWPSAYASGALVQCRKKGSKNWGKGKNNESTIMKGIVDEGDVIQGPWKTTVSRRKINAGGLASEFLRSEYAPDDTEIEHIDLEELAESYIIEFLVKFQKQLVDNMNADELDDVAKKIAREALIQKDLIDEATNRSGVQYLAKNLSGKEKAFKNIEDAYAWKKTYSNTKPYYGLTRPQSDAKRSQEYKDIVNDLYHKLTMWAGEYFPDGDPHDELIQYCSSKGWDDRKIQRYVRAALKKINPKYTSYSDFLADMWDDYAADNPELQGGNPWKTIYEEPVDEACWDGYRQAGMKKKGNRTVPNCVPKESVTMKGLKR